MVSQFTRPASSHLKSLTRHVNLIAFRKSIFFKKRDAAAARHPGDLSQCTLRVSSPSSDSVTFQIKAGGEASATERKLSSRTCNVMKSPPPKKKNNNLNGHTNHIYTVILPILQNMCLSSSLSHQQELNYSSFLQLARLNRDFNQASQMEM